jgi:hypothetical protein
MPNPIKDFCITCHEDNLLVIAMAESLKFTPWTKHIAINSLSAMDGCDRPLKN